LIDPDGSISDSEMTSDSKVDSKKQLLNFEKCSSLMFNEITVKKIASEKETVKGDKSHDEYLVDYSYHIGQGICDDVLYLIFEHLLKTLMRLLISVKDTIRPDVLVANINQNATDATDISEALNDIESLVNNGDSVVDFRSMDPTSILNTVYDALLNSTKVVPGIQNFTNFDLLQYPDLSAKTEKLTSDIESLKQTIMNNIGIPADLVEGSSNRWEVISRSSRFLTLIESHIEDLSRTVKRTVRSYLKRYENIDISIDDIGLVLDTSNIIFNNHFNNKTKVVTEKLEGIGRILEVHATLRDNEATDSEAVDSYFERQLNLLDPELSDIITNMKKKTPKINPRGGRRT